jgi:hypothetical protein
MQVHILALAEGRLIFLCLDNKSPLEEWIFVLRHRRLREKFPSILLNGHRLHRRKARLIHALFCRVLGLQSICEPADVFVGRGEHHEASVLNILCRLEPR